MQAERGAVTCLGSQNSLSDKAGFSHQTSVGKEEGWAHLFPLSIPGSLPMMLATLILGPSLLLDSQLSESRDQSTSTLCPGAAGGHGRYRLVRLSLQRILAI